MADDESKLEERLREFFRAGNHELPQDDEFYEALGRAIGAWSQVEGALYGMFLTALKLPHKEPAAAAFHAIVSFQGRLRMVDSAVQFSLAGTMFLPLWNAISERVRKREARRNQAAHFMPLRDPAAPEVARLYLGPHPYDVNRNTKSPPPIFTTELLAMAADFRELANELNLLVYRINEDARACGAEPAQ